MGKALLIKNADFTDNALTTVTITQNIPCTAIELSETSISFTDYTPVTVTASVTPINTTDTITWSSSDTSVATVASGIITPVGFGSATITATCGGQSDTVAVTVTFTYIETFAFGARTSVQTNVNPNIVATSDSGYRFTAYGSGVQATVFEADRTGGWSTNLKGIKLPGNTTKVRVSRSADKTSFFDSSVNYIVWTKDEWSGNNTWPNSIKPILQEEFNFSSNAVFTYDVPSGADSCFINIVFKNKPADFEATIAETGIHIEFLAS